MVGGQEAMDVHGTKKALTGCEEKHFSCQSNGTSCTESPVTCYLGEETDTHLATTSLQVVVESVSGFDLQMNKLHKNSSGASTICSRVLQRGAQGGFLNQGSRESCQEPAAHLTAADRTWAGPGAMAAKRPHPRIKEALREH
ncbi:hypothetical protein QYF61_012459 [Mycteria americana]|uniref:Uncharacterized protein n=1 Tax=Mycteria americana TaxID=33587 RepID=A0AAN7NUC6_MYCAM|nr:hypothetical protein QYF61_012459 [Mycteria americana]